MCVKHKGQLLLLAARGAGHKQMAECFHNVPHVGLGVAQINPWTQDMSGKLCNSNSLSFEFIPIKTGIHRFNTNNHNGTPFAK